MARRLHGVDCPVNDIWDYSSRRNDSGARVRFPDAMNDWVGLPLTLRERKMVALMGEMTDKHDWHGKVFDEKIVATWRAAALALNSGVAPEIVLTEKAFDYCIDEVRDYASQLEDIRMVPAISAGGLIYKSDVRISPETRDALKAAAAPLENVEDDKKDWRSNSDEMILDLVDPSLFPLLYGRSTVLPVGTVPLAGCESFAGMGDLVPVPKKKDLRLVRRPNASGFSVEGKGQKHFYSKRFQWIPCEVAFRDGGKVEITSYVNNVHPRTHKPLYQSLQDVIAQAVPMWDACFSRTERYLPPRDVAEAEWSDAEDEAAEDDCDDGMSDILEWVRDHYTLSMPDLEHNYYPRTSYGRSCSVPGPEPIVDLRKDFAPEGLQIVVKFANIQLTPGKPAYKGERWHIEGMLNEHICASAFYCYDRSNITESCMSFRESIDSTDLTRRQLCPLDGNWEHVGRPYGIEEGGPAVQNLGHVTIREGRLLTFLNVFQHRMEPFSLKDKSRPGHCKILALFLIDPHLRIPSTANVPPQQKEWWKEMVYGLDRVASLPPELAEGIVDSVGNLPVDLAEAKQIRSELIEERNAFAEDVDIDWHADTFVF